VPLLAIGSGNNTVVLTADTAGASASSSVDASTGRTVIAVASGVITLPHNAFAADAVSDGKLYAGELAAVASDGKVVAITLGTPAGGAAGDALSLALADNLGFAGKVPRLDANSARLGQSLQTALAQAVGGTLVVGQSNGVFALDVGGSRLYLLPLGEVMVDRTRGDGVLIAADGTLSVSVANVVTRLAPSVSDPGQLARDLAAIFPGASLQVASNGTLLVMLAGQVYVLRPGWLSQADPALGFDSRSGQVQYGQGGRRFTLSAAVADYANFAAVVQQALPAALLSTNADGTLALRSGGQSWTLVPEMSLQKAPAGAPAWWNDAGTLRVRNADGTTQGFAVQ